MHKSESIHAMHPIALNCSRGRHRPPVPCVWSQWSGLTCDQCAFASEAWGLGLVLGDELSAFHYALVLLVIETG